MSNKMETQKYYCCYSQFNALGVGDTAAAAQKNAAENFDFSTGNSVHYCEQIKYTRDAKTLNAAQESGDLDMYKIISVAGGKCKIRK